MRLLILLCLCHCLIFVDARPHFGLAQSISLILNNPSPLSKTPVRFNESSKSIESSEARVIADQNPPSTKADELSEAKPHKSFLDRTYLSKDSGAEQMFYIRQVPGDGGCLFHSLALSLNFHFTNRHADFDSGMRRISNRLRKLSVQILKKGNMTLVLENNEEISSSQLLDIVSDHYNMTRDQYCSEMLQARSWGGGPEIVAISNHLERPIHVYGLEVEKSPLLGSRYWMKKLIGGSEKKKKKEKSVSVTSTSRGSYNSKSSDNGDNSDNGWSENNENKRFYLRPYAKFGSPAYDGETPLHILCCDGRFPNMKPGELDSTKPGNHFMVIHPVHTIDERDERKTTQLREQQREEQQKQKELKLKKTTKLSLPLRKEFISDWCEVVLGNAGV